MIAVGTSVTELCSVFFFNVLNSEYIYLKYLNNIWIYLKLVNLHVDYKHLHFTYVWTDDLNKQKTRFILIEIIFYENCFFTINTTT